MIKVTVYCHFICFDERDSSFQKSNALFDLFHLTQEAEKFPSKDVSMVRNSLRRRCSMANGGLTFCANNLERSPSSFMSKLSSSESAHTPDPHCTLNSAKFQCR